MTESSSYQTDDLFYDIIGSFRPEPSEKEIRKAKAHVRQKVLDKIYFLNGVSGKEEVLFQRAYFDVYELQIEMYTNQKYPYSISHILKSGNNVIETGVTPFKARDFAEAVDRFNRACELLLYFEKVRKGNSPSSKIIRFKDSDGKSVYARVKLVNGETQILKIRVSDIQKVLIDKLRLHSSNLEFLEYDYDSSVLTDNYSEFGDERQFLVTYDSNLLEIFNKTNKVFSLHNATSDDFIEACQIVTYMNDNYYPSPNVDEFYPVPQEDE